MWLRDQLGDQFAGGVVLHTARHVYPLADRIVAGDPENRYWNVTTHRLPIPVPEVARSSGWGATIRRQQPRPTFKWIFV